MEYVFSSHANIVQGISYGKDAERKYEKKLNQSELSFFSSNHF